MEDFQAGRSEKARTIEDTLEVLNCFFALCLAGSFCRDEVVHVHKFVREMSKIVVLKTFFYPRTHLSRMNYGLHQHLYWTRTRVNLCLNGFAFYTWARIIC